MVNEIWKNIIGFEKYYQISNLGNVKSLSRTVTRKNHQVFLKETIVKTHINTRGYLSTTLYKNAKEKRFLIHRLIAIHFIPNINNYDVVNHINSDKLNNSINNLEWVNQRENCTHDKLKQSKSSKYVGVSYDKNRNKYISFIRFESKKINLGRFETEIEAYNTFLKFVKDKNITNKYLTNNKNNDK